MNSSNQFNLSITLFVVCLGFYLFMCLSIGFILVSSILSGTDWGITTLVKIISQSDKELFVPINSSISGYILYVFSKENLPTKYPKAALGIVIFCAICATLFFSESLVLASDSLTQHFPLTPEQLQSTIKLLQTLSTVLFSYIPVFLGLKQSSNQ